MVILWQLAEVCFTVVLYLLTSAFNSNVVVLVYI